VENDRIGIVQDGKMAGGELSGVAYILNSHTHNSCIMADYGS